MTSTASTTITTALFATGTLSAIAGNAPLAAVLIGLGVVGLMIGLVTQSVRSHRTAVARHEAFKARISAELDATQAARRTSHWAGRSQKVLVSA
jgi:threonine dehydrogenase-like Zn-dependent dehydrogenase